MYLVNTMESFEKPFLNSRIVPTGLKGNEVCRKKQKILASRNFREGVEKLKGFSLSNC